MHDLVVPRRLHYSCVMGRKGGAYLAFTVAAFMGLGITLNLGDGHGVPAYGLAMLFCVVMPVGFGIMLLRSPQSRDRLLRAEQAWDSELLRLAERRGGSLTVSEVVAYADLAPSDAERRLEAFCSRGLAEHRISDEGVIVYRFEPMLNQEQKARARLGCWMTEVPMIEAPND